MTIETSWNYNPNDKVVRRVDAEKKRPQPKTLTGAPEELPTYGGVNHWDSEKHARRTWRVALLVAVAGIALLFTGFTANILQEITWLLLVLIIVVAIKY